MTSGSMPVDQEDQADMLGNNELVAEFAACVRFFMHTLHAAVSHVDIAAYFQVLRMRINTHQPIFLLLFSWSR